MLTRLLDIRCAVLIEEGVRSSVAPHMVNTRRLRGSLVKADRPVDDEGAAMWSCIMLGMLCRGSSYNTVQQKLVHHSSAG